MTDQEYVIRMQEINNLRHRKLFREAFTIMREVVREKDRIIESTLWHTAGQISTETGDFVTAERTFKRAIELFAESHPGEKIPPPMLLGLAYTWMRNGNFEQGLPIFEAARLGSSWVPWPGTKPLQPGERAKHLLIQCEGGYGDQFLFFRWLPILLTVCDRFSIMVWKPLERLYWDLIINGLDRDSFQALRRVYVVDHDKIQFGEFDRSISIMSLPYIFGVKSWSDIPPSRIDMFAGPRPLSEYQHLKIGLCWRSEEVGSPVRVRSMNQQEACVLSRLFHVPIYSLSPAKVDLYTNNELQQPTGLRYEPEQMKDWRATANYLDTFDFVITVDTAVAHLCGLIGIPALVLLPVASDWKWGMPDTKPVWYGKHIHYYRETDPASWSVEKIAQEVASVCPY